MNIFHLLLCIYCLVEENAVTANDKECSSRSETEAGGYFKLAGENVTVDCIKKIKVNKGFRVRMFLMSPKNTFGIDVAESSERSKSPGQEAINHNLEMFESKDNEIEVRIDPKSAPLDVQWWRVCGGTLDRNSGKLIGPDHASGYPENQTCTWNITVLNGYMLSLTLNVDGYNDGTNCSLDYIQIMEVQSEETISRRLICSGILTLKSNKSMRIVFHSDNDSTSGLSFNASWVSKCGENFSSDNGELASPDNPVDFHSEVKCNWNISVPPGHTIVLNYTLPKTSKDEASCKSYVQKCALPLELYNPCTRPVFVTYSLCLLEARPGPSVICNQTDLPKLKVKLLVTEGDSDASKILCKSSKFAAFKSISNTLRISFMYEPGMNYARFYATWHSEDAQRHEDKISTTEVGQREGSNGPTKAEGSNGSTKAPLVTLQEKDNKVNKTSLSVADVILQTVAAPMTLVIFIIICLLLVRRAKSMGCFSKEQTAYDTEENMYDSLSEINVEVDNSKLEIRKDIHLLRKKSFNPQMFRRRLPTIPTGRLSAILAQVGQRIQFGNDRYDTAYDEAAERQHTEFHESKQEDAHSEQEKLSITNKSTRERFINASYISGDNADHVKRRSVCSIKSVENDCVMNESTVETMNNDGYLTPVDLNSSLTEKSTSKLPITNKSTRESLINASYISGDNADQVKRRSVCSIKSVENDCVMNESTVETMNNDGYLTPLDFNSSLTDISTSMLSISNKSTRESFINTSYISGDNADQVKGRSVWSIKSVENDCVMNESTVETMNNDGYLTPVDLNSSLTEKSTSKLPITNKSTRESLINASYISGDNVDQVIKRSVCSIKSAKNDSVINESTVETMDNDGYLILVDFNSSLTQTSISIADSDSMKLNVAVHHEEDKQLNTSHCIGQDNASYTCMGDFVDAPNTAVCIRLDNGAEGKDLYGGKYETHGKHAAIKETRTEESTDSYLTLPSYPGS